MSELKHKTSSPDSTADSSTPTALSIADKVTNEKYQSSNKFILIDAQEELDSIRKLADETDFLTVDGNNNNDQLNLNLRNSINNSSNFLGAGETSTSIAIRLLKMDAKRKTNSPINGKTPAQLASAYSPTSAAANSTQTAFETSNEAKLSSILDQPAEQSTVLNPSYPSIFAATAYRRPASPPQQSHGLQPGAAAMRQNGSRGNLRKQPAAASTSTNDTDSTTTAAALNRLPNRKLIPFSYGKEHSLSSKHDEEDLAGAEEEEIDERVPFSAYLSKSQSASSRRISPEYSTKSPSSPSKQSMMAQEMAQQQRDQQKQNPHTKISINTDSRPPSFNMCQSNGFQEALASRKFDWQDHMGACPKCDCANCRKRRKIATLDGQIARQNFGRQQAAPNQIYVDPSRHSRTKTVHLVLKSIILVLLTLLLLMLVLGMLAASHYLPQMFDKVLNVSRSFNVTIAG